MDAINRAIEIFTGILGWLVDVLGTILSNPVLAIVVGGIILAAYLIFTVFRNR